MIGFPLCLVELQFVLEVGEGVSPGEAAAAQPVADIAVAADIAAADIVVADIADQFVDDTAADIAAAALVVGYGIAPAVDFEPFLLPLPAAAASAVG